MSPRSTTRPLYFWCFVSNSAFFRWQMSINDAKWTVAPDVLASSITCFSLLTFVRFHAENFSNFSHSLSTAALAAGIIMAWGIGINLCTKFSCCRELSPFPAIWSSWWVGNDSPIRSLVDSLASRIHASLDLKSLVLLRVSPCLFFLACLARHGRSHRCFQFLTSIIDGLFELLILRVNEIDRSQFSCIFKMELLIRPLLLLLQLSISSQFYPELWP